MNSILHLKYAVEVEKAGSISRAAENLYMSQPHLSKAIRDLEEDVGVALFDRTAKGVVPTEKGCEFLVYAKNILAQIEQIEQLRRPSGVNRLRFSLCAPHAAYVAHAFAQWVSALDERASIALNYREAGFTDAINAVADNSCDLAVARYPVAYERYYLNALEEKHLASNVLLDFSYSILMSLRHPLAQAESLDSSALQNYVELVRSDGILPTLPPAEVRELARSNEKERTVFVLDRASQLELLSGAPLTYMWSCPAPKDILLRYQLAQRPCALPQNGYRDLLVFRQDHRFSPHEEQFVATLRQTVSMLRRDESI